MITASTQIVVECLISLDRRKRGDRFSVTLPRAVQLVDKRVVRVVPADKETFAEFSKAAR